MILSSIFSLVAMLICVGRAVLRCRQVQAGTFVQHGAEIFKLGVLREDVEVNSLLKTIPKTRRFPNLRFGVGKM